MKHLFKQPFFYTALIAVITLGLVISNFVFGWTKIPSVTPPGGNVTLGSSQWTASDSGIFYNTGNVGIGTMEPGEKLEVAGAIKIGTTIGTANGTIRWTGSDFEGRISGSWVSLTASSPSFCDTLTDSRDDKTYATILIGSQCWMAENLNVGTMIPGENIQGTDCYSAEVIEKYCYEDNENICTSDGGLYQWDQAMCGELGCNGTGEFQPACSMPVQGICPDGWHIPSHYEYVTLERAICTSETCVTDFRYDTTGGVYGTNEGTKLKVGGTSGFEGLYAGFVWPDSVFDRRGTHTYFWSSYSSEEGHAWYRRLDYNLVTVERYSDNDEFAQSVRCIKD